MQLTVQLELQCSHSRYYRKIQVAGLLSNPTPPSPSPQQTNQNNKLDIQRYQDKYTDQHTTVHKNTCMARHKHAHAHINSLQMQFTYKAKCKAITEYKSGKTGANIPTKNNQMSHQQKPTWASPRRLTHKKV